MKLLAISLLALLSVGLVTGATINMMKVEQTHIGLEIDELYYVVSLEGTEIIKIEKDGVEEVEFTIQTTKESIVKLLNEYPTMTEMQRVQYVMNEFNIPLEIMMDIAAEHLTNKGQET